MQSDAGKAMPINKFPQWTIFGPIDRQDGVPAAEAAER
jgi:hypothetical protein